MSATKVMIDLTWSDSDNSDSGDLTASLKSLSVETLKPVDTVMTDEDSSGKDAPNRVYVAQCM